MPPQRGGGLLGHGLPRARGGGAARRQQRVRPDGGPRQRGVGNAGAAARPEDQQPADGALGTAADGDGVDGRRRVRLGRPQDGPQGEALGPPASQEELPRGLLGPERPERQLLPPRHHLLRQHRPRLRGDPQRRLHAEARRQAQQQHGPMDSPVQAAVVARRRRDRRGVHAAVRRLDLPGDRRGRARDPGGASHGDPRAHRLPPVEERHGSGDVFGAGPPLHVMMPARFESTPLCGQLFFF
mmetsp:Transcript_23933/g.57050  ORF Transcript_23933/g.57050 Transcript_23933/m.57050 type:complete len:241 (-) Transcript_23933:188-910(-)